MVIAIAGCIKLMLIHYVYEIFNLFYLCRPSHADVNKYDGWTSDTTGQGYITHKHMALVLSTSTMVMVQLKTRQLVNRKVVIT